MVFPYRFQKIRYFLVFGKLLLQVGEQRNRFIVAAGSDEIARLLQTLPLLLLYPVIANGFEQPAYLLVAREFFAQLLQQL